MGFFTEPLRVILVGLEAVGSGVVDAMVIYYVSFSMMMMMMIICLYIIHSTSIGIDRHRHHRHSLCT